jgi:DHA2 family multidrug resistance protein-like MFS transporter
MGLTTELIVGSAPPERAGAASGISETAIELGGALGISILGSIGVAIYRSEVARSIPASIPADVVAAARDTLGGATGVAAALPDGLAATLLDVARNAFVHGMQVVAAISLVVAVAVAILAIVTLRDVRPSDGQEAADLEPRRQGERPARPVGPCAFTPEA